MRRLLALVFAFAFLSCSHPPELNGAPKADRSLIYGQMIDEKGSASEVFIETRKGRKKVGFSTWKKGDQKGLFIVEVDSGGYIIRKPGDMQSVGGGATMGAGNISLAVGSGRQYEDRSAQTQYFDKSIYLPAGKTVFVGTLVVKENSIEVFYEKKDLDKIFSETYPSIDFAKAVEIYPE
ncbi:MAG: hypothetical protein ABIY63_18190 [Fibrobacteria bacterium]